MYDIRIFLRIFFQRSYIVLSVSESGCKILLPTFVRFLSNILYSSSRTNESKACHEQRIQQPYIYRRSRLNTGDIVSCRIYITIFIFHYCLYSKLFKSDLRGRKEYLVLWSVNFGNECHISRSIFFVYTVCSCFFERIPF